MDLSLYGFKGLTAAYNIHPAFVHFPVALLPVTLFFYGLGVLRKSPSLLLAGRVCLYLALLAVVGTVTTGLLGADDIPHDTAIHHIMETHKHTGFIVLGLTAFLAVWSFWATSHRPRGAWGFVGIAAIATYFVVQNGDLGSRMVFVQGAGVKPAASIVLARPGGSAGESETEERGGSELESGSGGGSARAGGTQAHQERTNQFKLPTAESVDSAHQKAGKAGPSESEAPGQ